jgi:hypothetical protein
VSTFAGSASPGLVDGVGTTAKFQYPISLAVASHGSIFVADYTQHRIREVTSAGMGQYGLFKYS